MGAPRAAALSFGFGMVLLSGNAFCEALPRMGRTGADVTLSGATRASFFEKMRPKGAVFARVVLFAKENHPCATPRERKGCALDLPLPVSAMPMLHALRKELRTKLGAAFDLVCSLPPLPLCGGVSDRTHVSFRTRSAAAAERKEK